MGLVLVQYAQPLPARWWWPAMFVALLVVGGCVSAAPQQRGAPADLGPADGARGDAALSGPLVTPTLPGLGPSSAAAFAVDDPLDEHSYPRLFRRRGMLWLTYRHFDVSEIRSLVQARFRTTPGSAFGAAERVLPGNGYLSDLVDGPEGTLVALVDTGTAPKGLWLIQRSVDGSWVKLQGLESINRTAACPLEGGTFVRPVGVPSWRVLFAHFEHHSLFGCGGTLRLSTAPATAGPWGEAITLPGYPPVVGAHAGQGRLVFGSPAGLVFGAEHDQRFKAPAGPLDDLASDGRDWWAMHSPDGGANWSQPAPLSGEGSGWSPNIDLQLSEGRLAVAQVGRQDEIVLHEASW
jgi:hypothetical protein